jgi:hypothetical protein
MQAILQIVDDATGETLVEKRFDALTPQTIRLEKPLIAPCMVGDRQAGTYQIFGYQIQPVVRLTGKMTGL